MTALVIDNDSLQKLKRYAESNPLYVTDTDKIMDGSALPPGERGGYTYYFDPNAVWKLVFTIEEVRLKSNIQETVWIRHMSMSLDKPGRMPSLEVVNHIAVELGFSSKYQLSVENEIIELMEVIKK